MRRQRIGALLALLALVGAVVEGLSRVPAPAAPRVAAAPAAPGGTDADAQAPVREVADLSEIRFRREFRVLVPAAPNAPDRIAPAAPARAREVALVEKFADQQFLLPVWVPVPRWQDLVPALLAGEGDLIAPRMRIAEFRRRGIPFTVPVDGVREALVMRAADARLADAGALAGREIALRERSSFWPVLLELWRDHPGIRARIIADDVPREIVLQRVRDLRYDMAVVATADLALGEGGWSGLRADERFAAAGNMAFGVHPQAAELKAALDDFLTREQLARRESTRRTDDLSGIRKRGVLRVLTRNNAATYFIWRGRPLGFEYELIGKFADEQGLTLEMHVAQSRDRLLPALVAGEADVVAASLAITAERRSQGVAFTRPYKESYELVVTRSGDATLQGPADLVGRTVTVRRSSPVWALLEELIEQGVELKLEAAPEDLETEEIIARVASGLYDVTVADAYSVKVALTWRDDVRAAFALDGPVPIGWAVRDNNRDLLAALDEFLDKEYRQLFYNIIHARYFENPRTIRSHVTHRADGQLVAGRLSPYDEIVRRHADAYGFDWPLIVAVMYRESRFDPGVVSWAGARGLMQLLPVTAQRFGVTDLDNPDKSILAGVRMLDWLYQRLEPDLPVKDRTWFALAAYNAGLGHLLDARRLARELGLDANRWFGNVEKAMLLLSKPKYYREARHGYVRGIEPVTYVRDIRNLYNAYRSMLRS